jgi:hypothetical protein
MLEVRSIVKRGSDAYRGMLRGVIRMRCALRHDRATGPHLMGGRDPDQAWFWTDRWQAMEREADEAIAAGRVQRFEDAEDLFSALDESAAVYDAARARS